MQSSQTLITEIYAAFNRRDIDAALVRMTENVSWPKASEGGRVSGKKEIRAYWTRQWEAFDPCVVPQEVIVDENGTVEVRVHQTVKSLGGEVLFDGEVWHKYRLVDGLIERMDVVREPGAAEGQPSAAFSRPRSV